jgi:hypothetical protein
MVADGALKSQNVLCVKGMGIGVAALDQFG